MTTIRIEPLTEAGFAPFGDVLCAPSEPGRTEFEAMGDERALARFRLALLHVATAAELPLRARRLERHVHATQGFLPLGEADFLAIVAPDGPGGRPDLGRTRAFRARGGMGVTYRAGTWHHPLTLLAAPARLAVWLWRDGGVEDQEFVDVVPFDVAT